MIPLHPQSNWAQSQHTNWFRKATESTTRAFVFELSQKAIPPLSGCSAKMRLSARVEIRVPIVGMCTSVLALRNLEVGPVPTVVPPLCPHQLPLSCHSFVTRRAPLPTVDLPSQNLIQNQQYRDTVPCLPSHTEKDLPKLLRPEKSVPELAASWYCSHQHTNKNQGFLTAYLCPNSWATNDDH